MMPLSQPDGEAIELHRHRCEVRQVLRWTVQHDFGWARAWLLRVSERRGAAAADRLREDARRQWLLGNRGAVGVWREVAGS